MRLQRHVGPLVVATVALTAGQALPAAWASSDWHVVRSPGGPVASLASTSFTSPSDGWVVGSIGESLTPEGIDALIEHWDGSQWRTAPTLGVPQSDEALTGVTSAGPSDAWAVGWQDPYGTQRIHGLLMRWDGQHWTTAQGAQGGAIMSSVAAVSPDDVWAAGVDQIQHFDGNQWSVVKPPRKQFAGLSLLALAPDDVWLVGTKPDGRPGYHHDLPYTAHWDGQGWSTVRVPNGTEEARLTSVSAASPTDIWAVGSKDSTPYVLHFDGTAWHVVPVAGKGEGSTLSGVSVNSAGDGWAVGEWDGRLRNGFAVERTFTVHWDGSSWTAVSSPNNSRHDNFFTSAFASADSVWAFGGDGSSLIERR